MLDTEYHTPTAEELSFLRIVTRGYPELEAQVESCKISAYDPTGYCDVQVASGPPFRRELVDGPSLGVQDSEGRFIEILLWVNEDGFLKTIEVMEYPDFMEDVYERYIESARNGNLTYRISP
ncbi:MAG TPA: hypothetical protein VGU66_09110 [Candidatus Elarobacter sp.]|nr:hypothetical protein [Candidatus Elarobacter sp.]